MTFDLRSTINSRFKFSTYNCNPKRKYTMQLKKTVIYFYQSMDFLRGYVFKNEPLISCPFLSSKLDSPVIKTLEKHLFTLSE